MKRSFLRGVSAQRPLKAAKPFRILNELLLSDHLKVTKGNDRDAWIEESVNSLFARNTSLYSSHQSLLSRDINRAPHDAHILDHMLQHHGGTTLPTERADPFMSQAQRHIAR